MTLEETLAAPQQTEEFNGKPEDVVAEVVKWVEENDFKVVGITAPTVNVSTDPAIVLFHNGRDIEDDTDKEKRVKEVEEAVRGALGLEVKKEEEAQAPAAPKTALPNKPKESTPPSLTKPEGSGGNGSNSLAG